MPMKISGDSLTPRVMGTEHELGIHVVPREMHEIDKETDIDRELFGAFAVTNRMLWYCRYFDGAMLSGLLNDGSFLSWAYEHQLEISTTECTGPSELVRKSRALQHIIFEMLGCLLAKHPELRSLAMYDSVVDTQGNSWGEHDNFSLGPDQINWGKNAESTPTLLAAHVLTQGIVSGAGLVGENNWLTAQKLSQTNSIYGAKLYGYKTAMFCHGDRLEIRCLDKNVSQWAQWLRVGSTALVLAMARADLDSEKLGIHEEDFLIMKKGTYDGLDVSPAGDIHLTEGAINALDVQIVLAEAAVQFTKKYSVNPEYVKIAQAWYDFCKELSEMSKQKGGIDLRPLLRADWAAKFWRITEGIKRDREKGIAREIGDVICVASDIRFSKRLHDAPLATKRSFVDLGVGYRLNDIDSTRRIVTFKDLQQAELLIPTKRAEERVSTVRKYLNSGLRITDLNWDSMVFIDENGDKTTIEFDW